MNRRVQKASSFVALLLIGVSGAHDDPDWLPIFVPQKEIVEIHQECDEHPAVDVTFKVEEPLALEFKWQDLFDEYDFGVIKWSQSSCEEIDDKLWSCKLFWEVPRGTYVYYITYRGTVSSVQCVRRSNSN